MAQKPDNPSLSLLGKLGLLPILLAVLLKFVFAALTGVLVSNKHRPPTYIRYVLFSAIRTVFTLPSSDQEQWATITTGAEYKQFCKAKKVPNQTEILGDDTTKLLWLGQKDAEHVLLYLHGGGYNLCANEFHFAFLKDFTDRLRSRGLSLAVAILEYDLAPYATYPRQLAQAALALNDLFNTRPASKIVICGDSGGGHLAVDVLLHLLQRHPDTSVPDVKMANGQKLKAAVLISPWIEQSMRSDSYRRNAWKDILSPVALNRWTLTFRNGKSGDQYLAPLTAPRRLWKGLNGVVDGLYIAAGSDELLVDDIRKFKNVVQREWNGAPDRFQYVEIAGEPHDAILLERAIGHKDSKPEAIIRGLVEDALSS